MSAAQESSPLSWRKLWNQKVASISLQRYRKPSLATFTAKQNREASDTGLPLVAWIGNLDEVAHDLLNPAGSFLHDNAPGSDSSFGMSKAANAPRISAVEVEGEEPSAVEFSLLSVW